MASVMKKTTYNDSDLHSEHQALISYFASKASPYETARILYNVLLLSSGRRAPDVAATIRYCLEDARISGEVEKVFRQKAADIERNYNFLTEGHMDVKYSLGSRTGYDDDHEQERALEILNEVNEFCAASGVLERMTGRRQVTINDFVLSNIPRVIFRLRDANPEEHLSLRATPQLKELIERSKNIVATEFIDADWWW